MGATSKMRYYMLQAAYTAEAWAALIENPEIRPELVRSRVRALGGDIESAWISLDEHDVVLILRMPDEVSAAALSFASASGSHIKSLKLTPLMTWEDGLQAMRLATKAVHPPPTSQPRDS